MALVTTLKKSFTVNDEVNNIEFISSEFSAGEVIEVDIDSVCDDENYQSGIRITVKFIKHVKSPEITLDIRFIIENEFTAKKIKTLSPGSRKILIRNFILGENFGI